MDQYDQTQLQRRKIVLFLVKFFSNPRYADDFVHGRIFSNRLSKFKQDENNDVCGRMDRHEGTIAWLQPGMGRMTLNGMDMSEDLAGPIQIQKEWLDHLHVFCVHACHNGNLDLSSISNDNIEVLRKELTIDDRCLSLGEYAVVVKNVPELINRMRSSARANDYRIAYKLVKYYDPTTFHGNFRDIESVFWKQKQFSFQREFRFVIDSGKLGECPLRMEIGDISDIALKFKSIELNGDKLIGGNLKLG